MNIPDKVEVLSLLSVCAVVPVNRLRHEGRKVGTPRV